MKEQDPRCYDIVIYNGIIITVNPEFDIIHNGVVCIKDSKIVYVGPAKEKIPLSKNIIDAKNCIIMPGLVNTHTHLPMTIFRGFADDLPLMTWLNEYIFPAESKYIDIDSVKIGTRLACLEMLLSGTTTCCDGYFLENHVAQVLTESGMRAVLGQGVIDFPAPGVPDPQESVRHAVDFVEQWKNKNPLLTPSIFCHSPYTCKAKTLQTAKQAANDHKILFQIHVSETKQERDQIFFEHNLMPVEYLDNLGLLDKNTLIAHGVWLSEKEIEILKERDVALSHNPQSNTKLASGIADIPKLLDKGVCIGLGTDGCASNNRLDILHEMDFCAKLHKVNSFNSIVLNAETVLKMATIEGAKAIGLESIIGSIENGKKADLIILDLNSPHLIPLYNPISHIVYAAKGSDVKDVIIDGKIIVENKKIQTMDYEEIYRQVLTLSKKIGYV